MISEALMEIQFEDIKELVIGSKAVHLCGLDKLHDGFKDPFLICLLIVEPNA